MAKRKLAQRERAKRDLARNLDLPRRIKLVRRKLEGESDGEENEPERKMRKLSAERALSSG